MLPGVVYAHGGGWVFGDRQTHDRLIRSLALAADAAIVFVDYTRAPEARHPVQNEQAYAVLGWLADNGAEVGVDPERLAVAGDSYGGNMATVVARLAKRRGRPQPAAQVLFFPTTDAPPASNHPAATSSRVPQPASQPGGACDRARDRGPNGLLASDDNEALARACDRRVQQLARQDR
jgi:acetyl esterase/lipase